MEFLVTSLPGYLQDRRQLCKVNGVSSRKEEIHCGVPQGSCLGPFLFIVYINDLPFCLESSQVTMYADDTSISFTAKSFFLRSNKNLQYGFTSYTTYRILNYTTRTMPLGAKYYDYSVASQKTKTIYI